MQSSPFHQVLPGLPGGGDMPCQYSATGHGVFREGFVVEFQPDADPVWVGNFQPGAASLSDAHIDGLVFFDDTGVELYR